MIVSLYYASNTMRVIMEYFFDNERPIYIQLVEQLKWEIIREELRDIERKEQ